MATENNNKNLNVPNLRFPEFSGEWAKFRNDSLFNVVSEKNKGKQITSVLSASQTDGMVSRDSLGIDIKFEEDSIKNYKIVREGDYVIHLRSFQGGFAFSDRVGVCSPAYTILRPTQQISYGFLKPFFMSNKFIDSLRLVTYGIRDGKSISVEEWLKLNTNLPSVEEQKKISIFLSLLDDRIATQIKIIEKLESLIRGISNNLLYSECGTPVRLGDILSERSERTKVNNQYEVLSSTVKGIFSQREYFSKDIASENNIGYKIIRLHDVVLSPQNLWMGNINYNDKFDIGIVSPSYKIFSIADGYDKRFVAAMLKTHRALYNYMLVSEQGASVVRRNLNMEAFEQLVFKMPPIDKQREIGNAISALQSRLELAVRAKTAYEKQKQWLLTQMFI